jgi:hypothetical protein
MVAALKVQRKGFQVLRGREEEYVFHLPPRMKRIGSS